MCAKRQMARIASPQSNGAAPTRPVARSAGADPRPKSRARVRTTGAHAASSTPNIRDLGERRRSDDAVRASEHLHRSIVETLDEGVVVQDPDGRIVAFNKSALRILGMSAEQLGNVSSHRPLLPLIPEDG